MFTHKLREEDVHTACQTKVIKQTIGVKCTKATGAWVLLLSNIIAENYCCRAIRSHLYGAKSSEIGFVGLEDDFAVCEQIFKYAYDCVRSECKRIRKEYKKALLEEGIYSPKIIRQMENAYGLGFCVGLEAAYVKQGEEHQEYGLVLATPPEVLNAIAEIPESKGSYGSIAIGGWRKTFHDKGFDDGSKFDPSTKLVQGGSY